MRESVYVCVCVCVCAHACVRGHVCVSLSLSLSLILLSQDSPLPHPPHLHQYFSHLDWVKPAVVSSSIKTFAACNKDDLRSSRL